MKRELLASRKEEFGILLDPRTKLAVLITIAVFILGGSFESVMQYYMILLAASPLLLLLVSRKWKGSILYILIFLRIQLLLVEITHRQEGNGIQKEYNNNDSFG